MFSADKPQQLQRSLFKELVKISGQTELVETPLYLKHLPDEPYGGSQLVGRSDPAFNQKLEALRVFGNDHKNKYLKGT